MVAHALQLFLTMASDGTMAVLDPDVIVISSASDGEGSDIETGESLLLPISPSKKVFTPTKRYDSLLHVAVFFGTYVHLSSFTSTDQQYPEGYRNLATVKVTAVKNRRKCEKNCGECFHVNRPIICGVSS